MSIPRISLAVAAGAAVVGAIFTQSLVARTQRAVPIEYARVTAYVVHVPASPTSVQERYGYRACVAAVSEWTCRDFAPMESSSAALRTALSTLGHEGWELVSAVHEDPARAAPIGLTYLFKRPVQ